MDASRLGLLQVVLWAQCHEKGSQPAPPLLAKGEQGVGGMGGHPKAWDIVANSLTISKSQMAGRGATHHHLEAKPLGEKGLTP